MLTAIFEAIKQFLGFGQQLAENKSAKIPMQENAIREKADTKVVKEEIKQDKKLDRFIKEEPKLLYAFTDHALYRECVNMMEPEKKPLYCGGKEEILFLLKRDPAQVLTNKQARQLREQVEMSEMLLFCVKLHPVSIHA